MSITDAMAHALAHFTTEPNDRPLYVGSPSLSTVGALERRGLLTRAFRARQRSLYSLSPRGAAHLATLIEAGIITIPLGCDRLHGNSETCGAGCYQHALPRWGMSKTTGGIATREQFREALAWSDL